MTVTENTLRLNKALAAVKAHCMCFRFFEDSTHYTVHYPAGMFPDGCRASLGMGRAKALEKMLEVMERHWNENGIHGGGSKMTAKILQFPGPRRHGKTARLLEYARDFMRHNPDKTVAVVSLKNTEVWRDGKLVEIVPREIPVSDQNRCDAAFGIPPVRFIDPETIQFPPHVPRVSSPEWSKWLAWPTPPKDEK